MIARRAFVRAVAGSVLGAPLLGAAAQQAIRVYQIGFLSVGSRETTKPYFKAFGDGLREFGYARRTEDVLRRRQ